MPKPLPKIPVVFDDAAQARLHKLLNYSWVDELNDYVGEPCENHIFLDMVALDNLLEGTDHTPEYWINQ